MPTGPGSLDAEGIYQFGEDDTETLPSDMLNLVPASVSTQFGVDRARMTTIEGDVAAIEAAAVLTLAKGTLTTGSYTATGNVSTTFYWGTITVTFGVTFDSAPAVTADCTTAGAVAVMNVLTVSTTGATIRVIRFSNALGTLDFAWNAIGLVTP